MTREHDKFDDLDFDCDPHWNELPRAHRAITTAYCRLACETDELSEFQEPTAANLERVRQRWPHLDDIRTRELAALLPIFDELDMVPVEQS